MLFAASLLKDCFINLSSCFKVNMHSDGRHLQQANVQTFKGYPCQEMLVLTSVQLAVDRLVSFHLGQESGYALPVCQLQLNPGQKKRRLA